MADYIVQTIYTVVDKASATIGALGAKVAGLNAKLGASSAGVASLGAQISSSASKIRGSVTPVSGALNSLASGVKQLPSAFSSLGGTASSVFTSIGSSVSSVAGLLFNLPAAIAGIGFGALAVGAATLGDDFEKTQLRIAGFVTALGRTKDIDQGLAVAAVAMERIRVAAAILPGEAQDYLEVFQAGLPVINSAIGGTMQQMTDFSNKFTAVTNVLGVDSAQAGRDLNLMLQAGHGRAGVAVKSFARMLPFMRQIEGQANLNAKAFNAMTQPERAELLTAAMGKLQPMLDKAANTFDAMKGAAISNVKNISRLATVPLFEGMKDGLKAFNNLLSDNEGNLTALGSRVVGIGRFFSEGIVTGLKMAANLAKDLYGWFEKIWSSPGAQAIFGKLAGAAAGLGAAASGLVSGGGAMAAAAGGMALAGNPLTALSIPIALFGGVLGELASRAGVVESVLAFFADTISLAVTLVAPLLEAFTAISVVGADLVQGVLAGLLPALTMIIEPVVVFGGMLFKLTASLYEKVRPAALAFGQAIGGLVRSVGEFLNPILRIAGIFILRLYETIQHYLLPVFNFLVTIVSGVITAFGDLLSWIGKWIGKAADAYEKGTGVVLSRKPEDLSSSWFASDFTSKMAKALSFEQAKTQDAEDLRAGSPSARGGGGRVNQDFRFSRFDIQQKFEGDMTPDQIAVAFARDLGQLGERRMESGFSPLFGIA
jgi:hypothetical protein